MRAGVRVRLTFLTLGLSFGACGDPGFFTAPADGGPEPEDAGPVVDPFEQERPSDELYATDRVPTFELEIADDDWQTLIDNPTGADWERPFVPATFTYVDADEVVEEVGVHFQGGYSLVNVRNGKYGFTIHFNEYDSDRLWRGLRHMKLKSPGFDASLLVEPIAYDVYRAMGLWAPRANHARLYVNGDYYGVYVNVEDVDQSFLSRRFRRDWGELWKISDGGWSSDFIGGGGYGGGGLAWRFHEETNEDDDGGDTLLARLLETWDDDGAFPGAIERHLDVEQALRQIACDLALDNWDGMSTSAWNFYFYRDVDDERFQTIPWGPDASFDQPGGIDVFTPGQESSRRLVNAYPDEFEAALQDLVDGPLQADLLVRQVDDGYDRIAEHEADDWRNVAEFEAEVPLVRDAMERRAEAVTARLRD